MFAGDLVADENGGGEVELAVIVLAVVVLLVALSYVPLRVADERRRGASFLVGVFVFLSGLIGVVIYIGVLLLPMAFIYLAVAFAPPDWSNRRTLLLAVAMPAGILAITGIVTGIGSLIEAGQP